MSHVYVVLTGIHVYSSLNKCHKNCSSVTTNVKNVLPFSGSPWILLYKQNTEPCVWTSEWNTGSQEPCSLDLIILQN